MLQAQMVLDQVISLVTTHWQQDVSEVYVCTSFVQAHRQYFLADAIDRPPVWPEVHLHVLLSHRLHCDHASVLIHLKYEKKPGGHWIIRDLMGLDLVGLASL